jgi:hypothetical protein
MSDENKSVIDHLIENDQFLKSVFTRTLSGDIKALCFLHDLATTSTEKLNTMVSFLNDQQLKEFQDYCRTRNSWPIIHSPVPSDHEENDAFVKKLKVGVGSLLNVTSRNGRDQTRQTNIAVVKLMNHIIRLRAFRESSTLRRPIEIFASNLQDLSRDTGEEWFFVIWELMLAYTPDPPWKTDAFFMPQIGTYLNEIGESAEANSSGSQGEVRSKRMHLLWQAMWRAFVGSINPQVGNFFRVTTEQVKKEKIYKRHEVRKPPSKRELSRFLRENDLAHNE